MRALHSQLRSLNAVLLTPPVVDDAAPDPALYSAAGAGAGGGAAVAAVAVVYGQDPAQHGPPPVPPGVPPAGGVYVVPPHAQQMHRTDDVYAYGAGPPPRQSTLSDTCNMGINGSGCRVKHVALCCFSLCLLNTLRIWL